MQPGCDWSSGGATVCSAELTLAEALEAGRDGRQKITFPFAPRSSPCCCIVIAGNKVRVTVTLARPPDLETWRTVR